MNLFKINRWLYALLFTLPCLFFSQIPHIISVLYFLFFALLELFLFVSKFGVRYKLEVGYLIVIAATTVFYNPEEATSTSDFFTLICSLLYFFIIIDLSFGFRKYWGLNKGVQTLWIFLSLLVPPLGIYYLKKVNSEHGNFSAEFC